MSKQLFRFKRNRGSTLKNPLLAMCHAKNEMPKKKQDTPSLRSDIANLSDLNDFEEMSLSSLKREKQPRCNIPTECNETSGSDNATQIMEMDTLPSLESIAKTFFNPSLASIFIKYSRNDENEDQDITSEVQSLSDENEMLIKQAETSISKELEIDKQKLNGIDLINLIGVDKTINICYLIIQAYKGLSMWEAIYYFSLSLCNNSVLISICNQSSLKSTSLQSLKTNASNVNSIMSAIRLELIEAAVKINQVPHVLRQALLVIHQKLMLDNKEDYKADMDQVQSNWHTCQHIYSILHLLLCNSIKKHDNNSKLNTSSLQLLRRHITVFEELNSSNTTLGSSLIYSLNVLYKSNHYFVHQSYYLAYKSYKKLYNFIEQYPSKPTDTLCLFTTDTKHFLMLMMSLCTIFCSSNRNMSNYRGKFMRQSLLYMQCYYESVQLHYAEPVVQHGPDVWECYFSRELRMLECSYNMARLYQQAVLHTVPLHIYSSIDARIASLNSIVKHLLNTNTESKWIRGYQLELLALSRAIHINRNFIHTYDYNSNRYAPKTGNKLKKLK